MIQPRRRPVRDALEVGAVVAIGTLASIARVAQTADPGSDAVTEEVALIVVLGVSVVITLRSRVRTGRIAGVLVIAIVAALAWPLGIVLPAAVALCATAVAALAVQPPEVAPSMALLTASLWLWHTHTRPAWIAGSVATAAVLWLAKNRYPTVTERLDAVLGTAGSALGRAITGAAAGLAFVMVVLPMHGVARLLGTRPLDDGWTSKGSTWLSADRLRRVRPERLRTRSLAQAELTRSEPLRRRRRVGAALLSVGLASSAVAVLQPWRAADEPAPRGGTFTRAFEDDPAFRDAPWAKDLRINLLEAWNNFSFNAALGGWTMGDSTTEFINVTDGERSTRRPDEGLGEPLTVWLLGGSGAFGAGQRDEHTIASELVARADEQGLALEVRNFGVPATTNWQTTVLLMARLEWDGPPDLVVVYDGANDMALQDVLVANGQGDSDRPGSVIDSELDLILRQRSAEGIGTTTTSAPDSADILPTPDEMAERISVRYLRGVEVMRVLCDRAGVPLVVAWQPDLIAKDPHTTSDLETLGDSGVDEAGAQRWREISDGIRPNLADAGVIDLTDVFDNRSEAIYWDTVHTNELGSRIVAEALFPTIAEQLGLSGTQRAPIGSDR